MSTKDSDFKTRKVEQAATIQLAASFLKIPQAMRAAGITDDDSKSAAKQMQVRRAWDAMQKSKWTNETLQQRMTSPRETTTMAEAAWVRPRRRSSYPCTSPQSKATPTRNPPPRDLWTAENKERLQSLKEMEISLEDTAVGRKKIVLEQQLNAATLSMSPTKWNELLEIRKQKWGKEGVVGAAEEVIGGAEGV